MKWKLAGLILGIILMGMILRQAMSDFSSNSRNGPDLAANEANSHAKDAEISHERRRASSSQRSGNGSREENLIDPGAASEEISRLLSDENVSILQASKALIEIATNSKVEGKFRVEALQHGLNLIDDEDFVEMVLPRLEANQIDSPELLRVVLDDSYNREGSAQLMGAVSLLKHTHGEMQREVIELLSFVTREDDAIGADYEKWTRIVTRILSEKDEGE